MNSNHILQIERRGKTIAEQETKLKKLQDALVAAWTRKAEMEEEKNAAIEELQKVKEAAGKALRELEKVKAVIGGRDGA